jgi:hypothetical protein
VSGPQPDPQLFPTHLSRGMPSPHPWRVLPSAIPRRVSNPRGAALRRPSPRLRAKGLIVVQVAQALGVGERTLYSYLKTTKA